MKKIYLAVFGSNLGMMSFGLFFGWSSPSLFLLLQDDSPIQLTIQQAAWVSSTFILGSAIGAMLCSYVINVIGRKTTLVLAAIPGLIGWMIIAFATSVWVIYQYISAAHRNNNKKGRESRELIAGRIVCGLSNGFGYMSATTYVGEISPANIRGILTSTLTLTAKFGLFFEWVVGPFLSVRDLALVSSSIPILFFFVSLISLPESPYYLIRCGRNQQAVTSLVQLRGTTDVSKEIEMIEKSIKYDLANDTGLWELISVPGNRKALMVVLGLFIIQQWSGSLAILSYAELIFNETKNQLEGKYLTMILGGVQVVFTAISASIVDLYNRRTLLLISVFGVSISNCLIALFFFLQHIEVDVTEIAWLPGAGSIFYIVMYAFGLATLPFTMMSEIFPTNVKAVGSMIGMLCLNSSAFAVSFSYQSIVKQYGIYVAFWFFSSITALGVVFTYYFVPETKKKTLQEIQEQLHGYKL